MIVSHLKDLSLLVLPNSRPAPPWFKLASMVHRVAQSCLDIPVVGSRNWAASPHTHSPAGGDFGAN